jgi:hypothetical protein
VHAGGPLFMTYYDNDYGGNVGPGSRFCVDVGGASLPPGTSIIDPAWQRSNEYFLAPSLPNANLQYYATNTYPLFHEDDSPAPPAFTWTTSAAWNGPSTTDMPVSGPGTIPGFVANDTWFWTRDRVGDGVTGTTYWFRANVDLGTKTKLARVTLSDKYHPGRIAVNDGIIVFLNGVAQPIMPNVSASTYAPGVMRDDTETGWSFDGVTLSLDALHDGLNEIAVMYDERFGEGGLGHLVLSVTAGDRAVDQAARRPRTA